MMWASWWTYAALFALAVWPRMAAAHETGSRVPTLWEFLHLTLIFSMSFALFATAKDRFDYVLASSLLALGVAAIVAAVLSGALEVPGANTAGSPGLQTTPESAP